jgi:hypothetical protein
VSESMLGLEASVEGTVASQKSSSSFQSLPVESSPRAQEKSLSSTFRHYPDDQ